VKAAVYHGIGDVRIEEVAEPAPGPGEVLVRVALNGICGTDLHEIDDGPRAVPVAPHPLTGVQAPVILGHEAIGRVAGAGAGVDDLDEGTLVAIEPLVVCGRCRWCRSGATHLCERLAFHGLSTGGGGLAELTVVHRSMLHVVPPGIPEVAAALTEPLSVAHHAVARSGAGPDSTAVVYGAGPIGIGLFLTLRRLGARALVVEPSPGRRAVVAALGAEALDPGAGPVDVQVRDVLGGGADISFDAAGARVTLASAVSTTRKGGTVVLVASSRQPIELLVGPILAAELTLVSSWCYRGDFTPVLEGLAQGAYPVDGWVDTLPLDRLHDALDLLRRGEAVKLLLDPRS